MKLCQRLCTRRTRSRLWQLGNGEGFRSAKTGDQLDIAEKPSPLARVAYKPFAIVLGIVGGLAARRVFKQVWQKAAHEPEPPEPEEKASGWKKVALAAAVQGAIFEGVKALTQRGGARAFERLTGTWPGSKRTS